MYFIIAYTTNQYNKDIRLKFSGKHKYKMDDWINTYLSEPNRKVVVYHWTRVNQLGRKKQWRKLWTKESLREKQLRF